MTTDRTIASGVAMITIIALSPVWTTSFGFLDDFMVLHAAQTDWTEMRNGALVQGRPIAGILQWGFFSNIHTIGQLAVVRAFSVVCLALVAMLAFVALRRLEYSRLAAWTFAVGMLWLPSTQVMASWATLLMGPAALLLAVLAARSASHNLDLVLGKGTRPTVRIMRLFPSAALLSTAVCAYQPAAMAYWPIACLLLLAPARRSWPVRRLLAGALVAGVVGALSSAVGYMAAQAGIAWVGEAFARGALVTDIGGKLHYLVSIAAPRIFDPWLPTPHPSLAVFTAVFLAVLVPFAIGGSIARRVAGLALVVAALPLSYLPSIVTAENWASARSLAGAYVVPLAAVTLAVQGYPRLTRADAPFRAAAAIAVSVVAVYAGYNGVSDYFSRPSHKELTLARAQVRPMLADVTSPVVVVRSDWTDTLAPGVSFDEFGLPSTLQWWVPVPLTQLLAREATGRWLRDVRLVARSDLLLVPTTTLVIDYGHLLDRVDNAVVYYGSARP